MINKYLMAALAVALALSMAALLGCGPTQVVRVPEYVSCPLVTTERCPDWETLETMDDAKEEYQVCAARHHANIDAVDSCAEELKTNGDYIPN